MNLLLYTRSVVTLFSFLSFSTSVKTVVMYPTFYVLSLSPRRPRQQPHPPRFQTAEGQMNMRHPPRPPVLRSLRRRPVVNDERQTIPRSARPCVYAVPSAISPRVCGSALIITWRPATPRSLALAVASPPPAPSTGVLSAQPSPQNAVSLKNTFRTNMNLRLVHAASYFRFVGMLNISRGLEVRSWL